MKHGKKVSQRLLGLLLAVLMLPPISIRAASAADFTYGTGTVTIAAEKITAVYSRYMLTADDVGKTIKVRARGTGGYGGTRVSAATAVIADDPVVPVTAVSLDKTSATVTVGGTVQLVATGTTTPRGRGRAVPPFLPVRPVESVLLTGLLTNGIIRHLFSA